jgi:hypothetical protein
MAMKTHLNAEVCRVRKLPDRWALAFQAMAYDKPRGHILDPIDFSTMLRRSISSCRHREHLERGSLSSA